MFTRFELTYADILVDIDPDCVEIIDDIEFEFQVETSEDE